MVDARIFLRAAIVGTILQLALALAGHFIPWVAVHFFMFGRMMAAATAGYYYGMILGRGYSIGALGGAFAGGLSAAPVIGISVLLGDAELAMIALGTGVCILTGAVGGAFGQIAAIMKKLGY